jgi:hypothetical protein
LLDRLLRGRVWVIVLGFLLIGLVAINVSLLKLNAEAGRNADKVESLRIRNTQLRAKVSKLASAERLETAGRELGLGMPIAGRVRYLSVGPGDGRRAARALRSAVPTNFAFAPIPDALPPAVTPAAPAPAAAVSTSPAVPAPAAPTAGAPAPTQGPVTQTPAPAGPEQAAPRVPEPAQSGGLGTPAPAG